MRGKTLKPRRSPVQSKLSVLTPEQSTQLVAWLKEHSYREVARLVAEHFGIIASTWSYGQFYQQHAAEILGVEVSAAPVAAAGVSVTITCQRPGEIKLAVHPLQGGAAVPVDDSAPALQAGGVEVVAICQREGEIKLAVFPVPGRNPEPEAED